MALGGVFLTDTDGNIGVETSNLSEKVCGLLFDISQQTGFWESTPGLAAAPIFQGSVVELNNLDEAVEAGITEYTELTDTTAANYLLNGVAYYHIKQYFEAVGGSGKLYVMFADCSNNWNALVEMQAAARNNISQIGVWTEQSIWKNVSEDGEYQYTLINELNTVASTLANDYYAPVSILLCPNSAKVKTANGTEDVVTWSRIPNIVQDNRYVSVLLSQAIDSNVMVMQRTLASKTPVGTIGVALAELVKGNVAESIGWVQQHNVAAYFQDIEFGFGDVSGESELASTTKFASLSRAQLDELDDKGYIFLVRYAGLENGVYFNGDQTCSNKDYRTIARNRVMNKSRRNVRTALLPYVNSPIKVDPATGQLSAAQITIFTNLVTTVLQAMVNAEEISGIGAVEVPASQNILKNDKLVLKYSMIPIGSAKAIEVTEGFVLNQ